MSINIEQFVEDARSDFEATFADTDSADLNGGNLRVYLAMIQITTAISKSIINKKPTSMNISTKDVVSISLNTTFQFNGARIILASSQMPANQIAGLCLFPCPRIAL